MPTPKTSQTHLRLPGMAFLILLLLSLSPVSGQATAPAEGTLSPTIDRSTDQEIAEGLRSRFAEIQGLEDLRVDVRAGIVSLSGEVLKESDRDEALDIAKRIAGVARVKDEMTVVVDPVQRLRPAFDQSLERLQVAASYLPLFLVSLVLVFLFYLLSRWIGRFDRLFAKLSSNRFAQDLIRQAVQIAVILIGVLIALDILDATALVGAVLGTAGVVGLALGFAFRDLVENYISSILLSIRQPFAPNDFVDIDSHQGKVIRLTSRATILMTLDGNHLRIPNSQVFKGVILNYTRNPRRRFDVAVGVGVGEDLTEAQRLGTEVLRSMEGVLDDPAPSALIEALDDSSVRVRFYGWVDQNQASFVKVKSEAIRRIKTVLEDAGMDLPEPIYRVHMVQAQVPEAAPKPKSSEPEPSADIQPEDDLDRQIAEDRAESASEKDFLDSGQASE